MRGVKAEEVARWRDDLEQHIDAMIAGLPFQAMWAVGGLLGLGEEFRFITMAVCAVPGLWLSASMTRRILRVEKKLRTIIPE